MLHRHTDKNDRFFFFLIKGVTLSLHGPFPTPKSTQQVAAMPLECEKAESLCWALSQLLCGMFLRLVGAVDILDVISFSNYCHF